MANFEVIVHGAKEVEKAFADVAVKVDPAIGSALRAIAKPVQTDAQTLSMAAMSQIGSSPRSWSRMRIGRKRFGVYVAERQHGSGGATRANLYPRMMNEAMLPALERHRGEINAALALTIEKVNRSEF
jgi:hypothetical protein